jgi:hypothetical protein
LEGLYEGSMCTVGACLSHNIPEDIALKCYVKHFQKVGNPNEKGSIRDAASIGMVFSSETSSEPGSFFEIRTPIKKHLIKIYGESNVDLTQASKSIPASYD